MGLCLKRSAGAGIDILLFCCFVVVLFGFVLRFVRSASEMIQNEKEKPFLFFGLYH